MFFSKEYDNALWLIAAGNKKAGNWIVKFIKHFPSKLLRYIQNDLSVYERYLKEDRLAELEKVSLSDQMVADNGKLYWYNIDKETRELEMGITLDNGKNIKKIGLSLTPVELENCKDITIYDEATLGEISINNYKIIRGVSYEESYEFADFSLVKSMFGKMKVETTVFASKGRSGCCKVDIASVPQNYSVEDLQNVVNCKKRILSKNA